MTLEYDTSLAVKAYKVIMLQNYFTNLNLRFLKLADKWEASRSQKADKLSFETSDIEGWNTNQIS